MCFSQNKLAPPPPMLIYKNKIKIIVNLAQFEIFHLLPSKKGNNSSFQLLVKRKRKLAMCICCVAILQESARFKLAHPIIIALFQTLFKAKSSCQRFVNLVFQMHLTSITRKDDLSFNVLVKFLNMAKKVI